jgi:hypothetical protein
MAKPADVSPQPALTRALLGATPAARYQAACEALCTRAIPAFDQFSVKMQAAGRRVSWRAEFEHAAYPSLRIVVADRDGQIMDTSLVLDLRRDTPRLFWLVTPRGQARYAYTERVPEGVDGISPEVISRGLSHLYAAALVG